MFKHTLVAAASAAVMALGASAANATLYVSIGGVVVVNNGQTSAFAGIPGFVEQTFNSTAIGALPGNYAGSGQVVAPPSIPGIYAVPTTAGAPNTSNFLTVPTGSSSGSLTITAPLLSNYLGMWWGSIDTYNSITFRLANTTVATFSGSQLPPATGNQADARYVNFHVSHSMFDSVILTSSQYAFETDNHVFGVVPVPASAVLMLSGIAGLAFASRRRSKKASATA